MDKMPLGLFKNAEFAPESSTVNLSTWNMLEERELRLISSQVPNNGFEQMIRWTEQGKLWKFPINNEQGILFFTNVKIMIILYISNATQVWRKSLKLVFMNTYFWISIWNPGALHVGRFGTSWNLCASV
jgi:Mitochondrial 28S ribosomal protein S31